MNLLKMSVYAAMWSLGPYLSDLQSHFTSYHLTEVKSFKSSHAIRLYELLMQYKKNGGYAESVSNLKVIFGVESSNLLGMNFNAVLSNQRGQGNQPGNKLQC